MSLEPVRDRNGIRLNIGEAIAILALLVTILSGLNGWFILPEKVHAIQRHNDTQDERLIKIESIAAERAETLVRIDERTKRIEEALRQVHPEVRKHTP